MSDRLDIVRVIDARVVASRRTVARSKQLANAAKDDLSAHEEWLESHRQQSREDIERYQRRLRRRHRLQGWQSSTISTALFLPRLCMIACRGVAASLQALDRLAFGYCASIIGGAQALGRSCVRILFGGIAWTGAKLVTLRLLLAAGLWLGLSLFGKGARGGGVWVVGAGSYGLSWLGPKVLSLNRSLAELGSGGLGKLADRSYNLSSHVSQRIAPKNQAVRERRVAPDLDQRRLLHAAFIRLRAERDQLQARIHALDQKFARRVWSGARSDRAEWAEIRQFAVHARRLLEVQEGHVLGAEASGGHRSPNEAVGATPARPLRAGHAIYEAPASQPGRRRSGPS